MDLILIKKSITEVDSKKENVQVSGVVSRYSIIKGVRPILTQNKNKNQGNQCRNKKKRKKT